MSHNIKSTKRILDYSLKEKTELICTFLITITKKLVALQIQIIMSHELRNGYG